jgi:hypothetical protein
VTAYIEFPPGYDVNLIDVATATMQVNGSTIPALASPTNVRGYDRDGHPDRMIKFDQQAVINALVGTSGDVTVTIRGQTIGGQPFAGSDTVRVIDKV